MYYKLFLKIGAQKKGCKCGVELDRSTDYNRIVGGDPVDPVMNVQYFNFKLQYFLEVNKYPWLVGVGDRSRIWCGGTLVASRYVITAAHCFTIVAKHNKTILEVIQASEITVWIGYHNIAKPGGTILKEKKVDVVRLFFHDNYETTVGRQATKPYDISVVELAEAIDLNTFTPACMAKSTDAKTFDGKMATVVGWGFLDSNGTIPNPFVPHEVQVPVIAASKCPGAGGSPADICAGGEGGKDSCGVTHFFKILYLIYDHLGGQWRASNIQT